MSKSSFLLALSAITLLLLAVFAGQASADLHLRDTYFVFPLRRALNALAGFSGLVFLVCFILERWLCSGWLGLIHSIGSMLLLGAAAILLYRSAYGPESVDPEALRAMVGRSKWLLRLGYVILAWQAIIPLNVLISATRR